MRNKENAKYIKKIFYIIGTVLAGIAFIFVVAFMYKFYRDSTSIDGIEGEELIEKSKSPDGKYEVKAYKNNGGATTDFAVLVVLTDLETGTEKNIYWQYHCDEAKMVWLSNDSLKINDVTLKVPNQIYDYRKNQEE